MSDKPNRDYEWYTEDELLYAINHPKYDLPEHEHGGYDSYADTVALIANTGTPGGYEKPAETQEKPS